MDRNMLEKLCGIPAIPGREDKMISFMRDQFEGMNAVKSLRVDKLGNLIVNLGPEKSPFEVPKVAVFAHMDEVGLMVNKIEEGGFLKVEKVGSPNRKTVAGQQVVVEAEGEMIPGVVGVRSYHFQKEENRYTVPHIGEAYIDIGADSREDVRDMGVDIGSMVTYAPNFTELANDLVSSKALDDRLGCFMLLELAARIDPAELSSDVYLIASVQEEFNVQGITPAMEIEPDVGFCLEVYASCDTPDLKEELDVEIGGGPVLTLLDFHGRGTLAGLVANPKLVDYLEKNAEAADLPVQKAARRGTLTDTAYSQYRGEGIIMETVSVPTRYLHAPTETASFTDIDAATKLLSRSVGNFDQDSLRGLNRG